MDAVGRTHDGTGALRVFIQPRASKNKVCGLHDTALKLAVTAPPVEGKANKAVAIYLAQLFGVGRSNVVLVAGQQSRRKTFSFSTLTEEDLRSRLQALLSPADDGVPK